MDSYDEIIKVINELLKYHYEILDRRNAVSLANGLGYLYAPEDPHTLPLESLPYDIDNQYLLVTGDSRGEFENFALSQLIINDDMSRNSLQFDWDRIERQV